MQGLYSLTTAVSYDVMLNNNVSFTGNVVCISHSATVF